MIMEKSKSFSGYSNSYSEVRFGFEDRSKSYSFNGPSGQSDVLDTSGNPEVQRRKRVAAYNLYTMEEVGRQSNPSGISSISLLVPYGFAGLLIRIHVGLFGSCFKRG
ncbi:hypothetical protein EZV62_015044 [Acer yangbiense]|uniref:Uncharacterized protein n=1 Tax=Acer yangbiense TaxID=1000413 RepID=A0A5C7HTR6_9ROSI|nr:hypothetical protein EZV62_015044 [Acer yangbiense]